MEGLKDPPDQSPLKELSTVQIAQANLNTAIQNELLAHGFFLSLKAKVGIIRARRAFSRAVAEKADQDSSYTHIHSEF